MGYFIPDDFHPLSYTLPLKAHEWGDAIAAGDEDALAALPIISKRADKLDKPARALLVEAEDCARRGELADAGHRVRLLRAKWSDVRACTIHYAKAMRGE